MNICRLFTCLIALVALSACAPIKLPATNQYKLESFSTKKEITRAPRRSLLISQPEAMAGYQTEQMLYVKKPFQLASFAESAWIGTPANMLYPLLIQTLQNSQAFTAVASSPFADNVDYRLDTQLLTMQQNFLTKPSEFELMIKVVITRVANNQVLASRILTEHVSCPADTPYGGVIAGNQATINITQRINDFIIRKIRDDNRPLTSQRKPL